MKSSVIIRKNNKKYEEESPKGASFLYDNIVGNAVLYFAKKRFVSKIAGKYMDTKFSVKHINSFIKKNNIDMSDYPKSSYDSFNDFFSRKIISSKRPYSKIKKHLISPADSKLLVYKISDSLSFVIKGKEYTIESILRDKNLAKEYKNGDFLVFRLSVDDYHRYYYIDDGKVLKEKKINGVFHTVGPVAFKKHKVFSENQREYSVLRTDNFGDVIQMEIGALMVGKIVNHNVKKFNRALEKGYFLFGGSTIVMMFKEGMIEIDEDILSNSEKGIETKVKALETIGRRSEK